MSSPYQPPQSDQSETSPEPGSLLGGSKLPEFLGHPIGLYALFFTEMWERFSYYGMRALLVLYLTIYLGINRDVSLVTYGIFTSLVYFTPVFGGILADRLLGQRNSIMIGGLTMAFGQFALSADASGVADLAGVDLLYLGLGLLIVGNGFFKPNISTIVGTLYDRKDDRRDSAYTIFYMGINLGAFAAPLICGPLGENVAWRYGFLAAGVGMLVGVATFAATQRLLGTGGHAPGYHPEGPTGFSIKDWIGIVIGTVLSCGLTLGMIRAWDLAISGGEFLAELPAYRAGGGLYLSVVVMGVISVAALVWSKVRSRDAAPVAQATDEPEISGLDAALRMFVIVMITLFSAVFWMGFEQAGSTLNLFAEQQTQREGIIPGVDVVPASAFQAVNPFFILTLAPLFAILWATLSRRGKDLPSLVKIAIGLILLGVAFTLMIGAETASTGGAGYREVDEGDVQRVTAMWLVGVYLLSTIAELFLSPVGLSAVNRLAPPQLASFAMGLFFLAPFVGNWMAGALEPILAQFDLTGNGFWGFLTIAPIGAGVLMLIVTPFLLKLTRERKS